MQKRVYTPARMARLRTTWHTTSVPNFPHTPAETAVQHLGRLTEFFKQLQEQLGPVYQHGLNLRDRIPDAVSTEPYWADLVSRNVPDADALIDVVELVLEARATRPATTTATTAAVVTSLLPPTHAFPTSADATPPPPLDRPLQR